MLCNTLKRIAVLILEEQAFKDLSLNATPKKNKDNSPVAVITLKAKSLTRITPRRKRDTLSASI